MRTPGFRADRGALPGPGGEYVARWFWGPPALNTRRALGRGRCRRGPSGGSAAEARCQVAAPDARLAARAKHLDSWRAWSGGHGSVRSHATTLRWSRTG